MTNKFRKYYIGSLVNLTDEQLNLKRNLLKRIITNTWSEEYRVSDAKEELKLVEEEIKRRIEVLGECIWCGCIPPKKDRDIITVSVHSEKLNDHVEHTIICKQCAAGKKIEFEYAITLKTTQRS